MDSPRVKYLASMFALFCTTCFFMILMSLFLYYSENESMTYEAFLKLLRNEIVISIGIFSVVWLMLRKQIKETFYGSPKKQ